MASPAARDVVDRWRERSDENRAKVHVLFLHMLRLCAGWEGVGCPVEESKDEESLRTLAAVLDALQAHHDRWNQDRKKAVIANFEKPIADQCRALRRREIDRATFLSRLKPLKIAKPAHLDEFATEMEGRKAPPIDAVRRLLGRTAGVSEETLRPRKRKGKRSANQELGLVPTFGQFLSRAILRAHFERIDAATVRAPWLFGMSEEDVDRVFEQVLQYVAALVEKRKRGELATAEDLPDMPLWDRMAEDLPGSEDVARRAAWDGINHASPEVLKNVDTSWVTNAPKHWTTGRTPPPAVSVTRGGDATARVPGPRHETGSAADRARKRRRGR